MPNTSHNAWGIAIAARATYLKPWFEGFAEAQPADWNTELIHPAGMQHIHPRELTVPVHPKLRIHEVDADGVQQDGTDTSGAGIRSHWNRFIPSGRFDRFLDCLDLKGCIIHEFSSFTLAMMLHAKKKRLPIISFGDVGHDNAKMFSTKTRLWHWFWGHFVDGRMAGSPSARTLIGRRKVPFIDAFHAVDSTEFKPLPKPAGQPLTYVLSGQLIPRKGLDLWFRSAARLRTQSSVPFRLRVLGGGDEAWAKQAAADAGVADLVDWCGFLQRDAMKQAFGTGDVFVLPSRFDSYGAVVHEAACFSLPLLVSQYAGAAEALVQQGVNGYIFDPYNEEEMCQRMQQMQDPALRSAFSIAARKTGETFCARQRGRAVWQWIQQQFLSAH